MCCCLGLAAGPCRSKQHAPLLQVSAVHQGQGGSLYTWGGMNESVVFGSSEKHDSNKVSLLAARLVRVRAANAMSYPPCTTAAGLSGAW